MNAGVWAAPLGASLDLARAALLEPGAIDFDAAADGTLVASFLPKDRRELIWVTRRGEITALPGLPFDTSTGDIALSPDRRRALLSVRASDLTSHFVVRDLTTGSDTPIPAPEAVTVMTTGATVSWTPAQRLLYSAGGIESWRIYDWPSDGSTGGRVLTDGLGARMVGRRVACSSSFATSAVHSACSARRCNRTDRSARRRQCLPSATRPTSAPSMSHRTAACWHLRRRTATRSS